MTRYNIFFPVHKGLRALLFDTAQQLQQTDFCDAAESTAAADRVAAAIALFESHAHKEDHYVLPAIAAYEPSVVAAFEGEHEEDHALGESLQRWLTALSYAKAPAARNVLGDELTRAFLAFSIFNLRHMAKEEQVINPLLWRYYTDAELHAITENIIQNVPPQDMAQFSRWMVRGLNNAELCAWLQGVRASAPPPVFDGLLTLAQSELPASRWMAVRTSLASGALAA